MVIPVRINVDLSGLNRLAGNIDKAALAAHQSVRLGFADAANEVENYARDLVLNTPKTGRIYERENGRIHQASAPGEPWANDTGNALSLFRSRQETLELIVENQADYAADLEFGAAKKAARPVLVPTANAMAKPVAEILTDAFVEALNDL